MDKRVRSMLSMGNHKMISLGRFGFQWWGSMRPAFMWTGNGKCYRPIDIGFWIRIPSMDRSENE